MSQHPERAPRIDRRQRVAIAHRDAHGVQHTLEAELMDVSKTGVGLRSPRPLAVGDEIKVTVFLTRKTDAGEDRVTVPARVTGCIPVAEGGHHHVGAALGKLTLHDAQLWHDTMQRWRSFVV